MRKWTKALIYNRELQKLLDEGVEESEAARLASEQTEEIFGDMCDQAYEEKRDRDLERDFIEADFAYDADREDRFFGRK